MKLEQGSYVTKGGTLSDFTYMFKKVWGPLIYFATMYRDRLFVKAQLRPVGKCSFSLENLFNVLNKTYIKENSLFVFFPPFKQNMPSSQRSWEICLDINIYIYIFFFIFPVCQNEQSYRWSHYNISFQYKHNSIRFIEMGTFF